MSEPRSEHGSPLRTNQSPTHLPVRNDWLDLQREAPLAPEHPVIDSHHHLYDRPGSRYLLEDYLTDLGTGHNVRATVFLQARAMLRPHGPEYLKPLGETEFANGVAAMSASGIYGTTQVCAGIVGFADLTLGDSIRPVLERHMSLAGGTTASGGRFCGIRQSLTWDPDATLTNSLYPTSECQMDTNAFRAGFAHLAPLGLSFDAWVFFHQLRRLAALARAFPETPIVVNHCGGFVGIKGYQGRGDAVFQEWRQGILELAACPNVMIKLSGLGMRLGGLTFEGRDKAPSSMTLAQAWRPWLETCLTAFGSHRCMFGSNFPVDKGNHSYSVGLNALKRVLGTSAPADTANVLWRSAKTFYRLPIDLDG